jgi:hemerythrin-like metal-binding protein
MAVFVWSERFATGHPELDAQHQRLLELVERLGGQRGTVSAEEAEQLVGQVRDYVRYHFSFEEAAWARAGLPDDTRARHARTHGTFLEQVERAWGTGLPIAERLGGLHEFLLSWLIVHILGDDKAMARAARGEGPREGERGDAEAVLLEATRNLYGELSARNAELAAANARLETQVAERTASLRQANVELAREREALLKMITRLDEARLQLLQAERLASVGQLAAGVAHEVNNPLAIVSANVEALGSEAQELFGALAAGAPVSDLERRRQEVSSMVADASAGLLRIKRIVETLRSFTRIRAQGWQKADLNQGLDDTLAMMAPEFGERITIDRQYGQLAPVYGEHGQLNQAFHQVLRNAAQAIKATGRITVRTRAERDDVVVEIADTGRGMSAEELSRACDPFFTTREVGKGLGLGLSVAWNVVRRHEGHLALDSRPGEGTTVTLRLPLRGPRDLSPDEAPAA